MSFNFMGAVTICNDFEAQENKVCQCFHCFPICLPGSCRTRYLSFLNVTFKPTFSLCSLTFIKRLFSSSLLSAIRVVSAISKIVGGAKLHLESNPLPSRDPQRAQTNLCVPEPRDPTETETELFECSCGGMGLQRTAAGAGPLGAAYLGMA